MSLNSKKNTTKLLTLDDFMSFPIRLYGAVGQQPYERKTPEKTLFSRIILLILTFGKYVLEMHIVYGTFIRFIQELSTFSSFVETIACASYSGYCMNVLNKMIALRFGKKRLSKFMNEVEEIFPKTMHLQNKYEVQKYYKSDTKLVTILISIYMFLCTVLSIFPVAAAGFRYMIFNEMFSYKTPYDCWYPVDYKNPYLYPIVVIHQLICTFVSVIWFLEADVVMCCCIIQICMQFDFIGKQLEEFEPTGHSNTDHLFLREIIKKHIKVLELSEDIDKIFSISLLLSILSSIGALCLTGFLVTIKLEFAYYVQFLIVLISWLITIFLICYFGYRISEASFNIHRAAYCQKWYNGDTKYKKLLLMIIIRAQKPAKLSLGKFSVLSLICFKNVMRTSYQSFAVLRTMYNKN